MNEPENQSGDEPDKAEALLQAIEQEGVRHLGDWFQAEYAELRTLARSLMTRERRGHTLSATALLHEACIRLLKAKKPEAFEQRNHFFSAMRLSMSQVLIDHARHRRTSVPGRLERDTSESILDRLVDSLAEKNIECTDFTEAIETLSRDEPRAGTAVSLYYFFDWKQREIAEYLEVSLATIENDLKFAKTWLRRRLQSGRES